MSTGCSHRDAVETINTLRFMRAILRSPFPRSASASRASQVHARMKFVGGVAAAIACAASAGRVDADQSARALAAGCQSCHQIVDRGLPTLHGQTRAALADKFRAFRDGRQAGTVMPQLAKGYTDAQVDAIAAWFAAQKVTPP
jgi:cytochrome c553